MAAPRGGKMGRRTGPSRPASPRRALPLDLELTPKAEPLRTIVVDRDPFARRVIKQVLQAAGVTVIAEARDGRDAVDLALHYQPDVVVMDIGMPELDGIFATRRILETNPNQLIVLLTSADGEDEIGLMALQAGAAGFLSKDVDLEALPRAMRGVKAGEAAISRRMTRRLVDTLRQVPGCSAGMRPVKSTLTTREWEVLDHLRLGRSTDDIAAALVLSGETIRSHVKNILRKLGVHSRDAAVAAADRMLS